MAFPYPTRRTLRVRSRAGATHSTMKPMLISVVAKPGRKNTKLVWQDDQLTVSLNAPAQEGRANQELVRTLAKFFGIAKSLVRIERGTGTRHKTVSIDLDSAEARERLERVKPPTQEQLL